LQPHLEAQIAQARALLANGYPPVPVLRHDAPLTVERNGETAKQTPGKQPHGLLWNQKERKVYSANAGIVRGWHRLRDIDDYSNTDIACGTVAAADIDVYEAELADVIEACAIDYLCAMAPRRVGQPPKRLRLYRAAGEPITKAQTPEMWKGDLKAKVEVLGQGQQFVAFGIHPATKAPFVWDGATPETKPLAELTAVTQKQVAAFVAEAERMLREAGYRTKAEIESAAVPPPQALPKPARTKHAADGADPFKAVNTAAMARFETWVPALFPKARRQAATGAWRVSSRDLGRDFEEDLSIAPSGIVDFGVSDQGDARDGKRTPIDLVIEHGGAANAKQAATWLADRLGIEIEIKGRRRAEASEMKPDEGEPGWRRRLIEGDNGYLANEHNVLIALRCAPELVDRLRFNELSHAAECTAMSWQQCEGWRPWTDNDDTALASWMQGSGVNVHPNRVAAAVQLVAADNPHHPVHAYLDGLKWDDVPRLDGWLATYLGVAFENEDVEDDGQKKAAKAKNTYLREVGRKSLIQSVARIFKPGCKADHALILEGPQGALKSSAVRALVKDEAWFADEVSDLGSKDSAQDLRGKWIIELAELSAMKRGDIERTKAFMSRATDHYRPSYGRRSQDFPRQSVFFGTTNADTYLGDETGGRGFWPVKVGTINLEALRRDRDQLWAEAVAAFKAGEKWWLDRATEQIAAAAQDERRIADVWEETLLGWARRQVSSFTISEALAGAVKVPIERQDRAAQMRVSGALKAHGWTRTRAGSGDRQWRYERKNEAEVGTEVGTPPDEVGTEVGTTEVGTDRVGWDEVGTPQKQAAAVAYKHPSQPSQPSQPKTNVSKSVQTAESDVIRGGIESLGNRLGRWDGWDAGARRDCDGCSDEPEPVWTEL
jgi:predicted P-loop ATPase